MSVQYLNQQSEDYFRVAQAIRFIEENFWNQPDLEEIAASVNLSPYHFHRLFKRWAGITPKQFLQFLTIDYAKQRLEESRSVLDASLEAGLSGPGRLHDLFITFEAITPGEYKNRGAGLTIFYGFHATPFGQCLLAATRRGVCGLNFVDVGRRDEAWLDITQKWPQSKFVDDDQRTGRLVERIFSAHGASRNQPLNLVLRGTNFQIKVWEALLHIPPGQMVSYGDVAARVDRPSASRAVAQAVAHNPIGFAIPCHRVIKKVGAISGYRWGITRKRAILGWEAGRVFGNVPQMA